MARGLTRTAAARFSFLLSIPIIAGAAALELTSLEANAFGAYSNSDAALASLAAGLSGYWAIRFLLRLVSTDDLRGFARYLITVSVLVLVVSIWLGPPDSLAL
jgi:undecaprenyl-diphosphatase